MNNSIRKEVDEAMSDMKGSDYLPISQERVNELVEDAKKGDREAKQLLINSHIKDFKPQVIRWRTDQPKITIEELFQIVRYGIHDASTKYDSSRKVKFRTFCNQYVIKHYYNHIHDLSVIKIKHKFGSRDRQSDENKQSIEDGIKLTKSRMNFDEIAESVVCKEQSEPEPSYNQFGKINQYFEILTSDEKIVLSGFFGLFGEQGQSIEELQIGLKRNTQKTIHNMKNNAIIKIRRHEEFKRARA